MNRKSIRNGLFIGLPVAALAVASAFVLQPSQARDAPQDAQPHKAPRCFDVHFSGRMHVVDDHTLLAYDRFDNAYKIDHAGCKSMTDYSQIGFVLNGSSDICNPHDAQILYSEGHGARETCIINGFSGVSPAEANRLDP